MDLFLEGIKFLFYSFIIVIISKVILVPILRGFAKNLNLKAKTIGSITGIATSMPEFLSFSFAAIKGLLNTSVYNIISSNLINFILYSLSIFFNKNTDKLKNKAISGDIIISMITIIIPYLILKINIELDLSIIPLLLLLFILFYTINKNAHLLYLKEYEKEKIEVKENIENNIKNKIKIIFKYIIYLILTGISLFVFGNLLGNVVDRLSNKYSIPQTILGITLGLVTSIPEVITFFEAQKYHKNINDKNMKGVIETTNNLVTSNLMNLCIIQSFGILLLSISN